jgi:hypothetical protein
MTINTKYSIKEGVWVMYHNRAKQARIGGIVYALGSVNKSLDEVLDTQQNSKDGFTIMGSPRLIYTIEFPTVMSDYNRDCFYEKYTEDRIFPSKEELLKSL